MARELSPANGQKTTGPAPTDHNGLNQDTFLSYVREVAVIDAKLEEVKSTRRGIRKRAKAAGIDLGHLDAVVRMSEWTVEEVRQFFGTRTQYALWLKLPLGHQAEMFADEHAKPVDPTEKASEWNSKGFRAGVDGIVFGKPPAECPPEHHQDWLHGYNDGQKRNAPGKGGPSGKPN